jgi:hypothetical protein
MNSPLVRVILATFAGYLAILLALSVYDWISAEYPKRPAPLPAAERVSHPFYHQAAVMALQRFSQLSEADKAAVRTHLTAGLTPMAQWAKRFDQTTDQIVCIGEHHEEATRRFLATAFFPAIGTDVLLLEATPDQMRGFVSRMTAGRDYYPLLGADILNVLRSATKRNPETEIRGIEETPAQQKTSPGRPNSRDRAIADNFWKHYRPGARHMVLFGALHCTNEPNWLFSNLRGQASPLLRRRMVNLLVVGEHQSGPVEAFVYFLDEIGVPRHSFVIPHTGALTPRINRWFDALRRQILEKYAVVVVFRDG